VTASGGNQVPAEAAAAPARDRAGQQAAAQSGAAARDARAGQPPELPYEQARDQLTELVKRLEAGGLTLEQSLELWERGERLADICAEWLEGARARLATAMAQRSDGPADPAAPF
jgi:exodeoxyribonuclease VII small subunit